VHKTGRFVFAISDLSEQALKCLLKSEEVNRIDLIQRHALFCFISAESVLGS
jgi:hypothetical protein